tara:strand:- start:10400 stop:11722 length:1323 start_codon:yes stop_codon:yes gene_type:complete
MAEIINMMKYEYYKESGVNWLEKIPASWEVKRIKSLSQVKRGSSPRPIDAPKYFSDNGEYSWVRIADVTANEHYLNYTKEKLSKLGSSLSVKLRPKDIFLSIAGSVGKPMIANINCCIHDGFVYFPNLKCNIEFIYRVFEAGQLFNGLGKYGTQLNLNTDTVGGVSIALPPTEEQTAIVNFLDEKTTQIDQAIAIKVQQVELLKERKQIIIQQAVTLGLNSHVAMKKSTVEWIDQIPEHWEIRRSKFLFTQRKEKAWKDDVQLSATQAYGVIPQEEYEARTGKTVVKIQLHLDKRKHVEKDDFVISMRSFQGGLERAWSRGCIRSSYIILKPLEDIDPAFYGYLLKLPSYIKALQRTASFIRDGQDLNFENFSKVDLFIPPLEEQQAIAKYIKQLMTSSEDGIELLKQQIEKLKEYKTTLINSAVTGKIKVPDINQPVLA